MSMSGFQLTQEDVPSGLYTSQNKRWGKGKKTKKNPGVLQSVESAPHKNTL
jgi:hypothetical protein